MSARRLKVLIIGGYGTFGGRLAELLSDEPRVTLVIAGRSKAKAEAFCEETPGRASIEPAALDRDRKLATRIADLAPDVVVDASGPFQAYGKEPYRVVKAALLAGADYLDIADSSDFVREIAQFDAAAKKKGKFALSGLSTCPVLTAAVVRQLARDLKSVDSIAGGIAPSPRAGLGRNVVRAVASYAGKPVRIRRGGGTAMARPFTETKRYTVAPPGAVPLESIEFSLIDVPDLTLLADLWPDVKSVWFGLGPLPASLHRCLRWLAQGVRRRLIPSLAPFVPLMHATIKWLGFGEHRSGMFVEIEGRHADGSAAKRSWHLIAEGDEGPNIPAMAAEVVIRKVLDGRGPAPGARPAVGELELADYERAFARRAIVHGVRGGPPAVNTPLFERILGTALGELPWSLGQIHGQVASATKSGRAEVVRGKGWYARTLASYFELPAAAPDIGLRVTFERRDGAETWRRVFGKQQLESVLYAGVGKWEHLLCERFGPFVFGVALAVEQGRLEYVMRRWTWLGIPLPRALLPRGETYEYEVDGRFHFHVEIADRLFGPVVMYEGYLE